MAHLPPTPGGKRALSATEFCLSASVTRVKYRPVYIYHRRSIIMSYFWWHIACMQQSNMPYEGTDSANQIGRKLVVFDQKLKGSHSLSYCSFGLKR